jgi:hypothetical protein
MPIRYLRLPFDRHSVHPISLFWLVKVFPRSSQPEQVRDDEDDEDDVDDVDEREV